MASLREIEVLELSNLNNTDHWKFQVSEKSRCLTTIYTNKVFGDRWKLFASLGEINLLELSKLNEINHSRILENLRVKQLFLRMERSETDGNSWKNLGGNETLRLLGIRQAVNEDREEPENAGSPFATSVMGQGFFCK